ncbi:MAG: peptidylprolyl isomerase [Bacteroidales bacterium]|nr:peptidylprolyl isomerase [Bacteroidales bacterium]
MMNKKVAILIIFSAIFFSACSQKSVNQAQQQNDKNAPEVTQTTPENVNYYVEIETNFGNIVVKLYNETPKHRDNFVKLVKEGFYDGLLFHRVIKNFMIQGGDPESKEAKPGQMLGNGSLGYTIPAEFVPSLYHKKGALAAARTGDNVNPMKESSSCQFYIVQGNVWQPQQLQMMAQQMGKHFSAEQVSAYTTVGGTPHLDGDYTVFGEVVEGLEVVDKIAAVKCGPMDRPVEDVSMKMKIVER